MWTYWMHRKTSVDFAWTRQSTRRKLHHKKLCVHPLCCPASSLHECMLFPPCSSLFHREDSTKSYKDEGCGIDDDDDDDHPNQCTHLPRRIEWERLAPSRWCASAALNTASLFVPASVLVPHGFENIFFFLEGQSLWSSL